MHLGHVLSFNLSDTADILQRSHWFIKQPNDTLIRFGFVVLIIIVCHFMDVHCGPLILVYLNSWM